MSAAQKLENTKISLDFSVLNIYLSFSRHSTIKMNEITILFKERERERDKEEEKFVKRQKLMLLLLLSCDIHTSLRMMMIHLRVVN